MVVILKSCDRDVAHLYLNVSFSLVALAFSQDEDYHAEESI